jgi:general secretion pathway protein F
MQFTYKAVDAQGAVETGKVTADSREQLLALLKTQEKVPLEIKAETRLPVSLPRGKFSRQECLNFTQQLAGLLAAGIPIERALAILARLSSGKETVSLIGKLNQALREGLSFTAALERFAKEFTPIYINMVRAGEAGGILPEVLKRLAQYLEEEIALRRFIISSLIYPAIVVTSSFAALTFFVSDVIPKFQDIFAGIDSELPLITKIVMFCGNGLTHYGWIMLLLLGIGVIWMLKITATPKGKLWFDRFKIQLPLIGGIQQKTVIAKMTMALGLLEQSGVPLLTGLQISAEIIDNAVFARALREVEREVKAGQTLAQSLENQKVFPVLAIEMIGVGEESGNLSEMLGQVAKTYEAEVKNAIGIFLAVFEPVLILLMVGIIAILAISILLPIINLNSKMG